MLKDTVSHHWWIALTVGVVVIVGLKKILLLPLNCH